tara:strand:+ start:297 stop:488 length:192 start_codon:yes stop_codon:yes gene_type:complete
MGLFAFRRDREKEAALVAASIPDATPKPKPKRKRKPKAKALTNGDNNSCDSGVSVSEQLLNLE